MKPSRRFFIELAAIIRANGSRERATIQALPFIEELCELLRSHNPSFNEEKFKEASGFKDMFADD
jgi:hypothetical protein